MSDSLSIRPLSRAEELELSRLEQTDIAQLYAEIAQQVGVLEEGVEPMAAGKGWIDRRAAELRQLVCTRGRYCEFIASNQNARAVEIIAAVGDVLATTYGGLPVFKIAAALVRYGLDRFCNCPDK